MLRNGGLSAKQFSAPNLGRNFQPQTLEEMRRREPGAFEKVEKSLHSGAKSGILSKGDDVDRNTISSPIEQGRTDGVGEPWAIVRHGKPLNDRQQALLDTLPEYDSRVTVNKSDVSMMDLAALTAKTNVEYAMFTHGQKRLIVRGNNDTVNVGPDDATLLSAQGYKWSGHTHIKGLVASEGDKAVLRAFNQNISVVYNAVGEFRRFYKG